MTLVEHTPRCAVMLQVEAKNKKLQELNRFVHYYSRFKNHENSYKVLFIFQDVVIVVVERTD